MIEKLHYAPWKLHLFKTDYKLWNVQNNMTNHSVMHRGCDHGNVHFYGTIYRITAPHLDNFNFLVVTVIKMVADDTEK